MNTTKIQSLEQLGLTENAAKAYLALITQGRLSYTDLAKQSGLNRASLYPLCKSLIDLGLVVEDQSNPVAQLVAQPVSRIKSMAQQELDEAERKMDLANQVIKELSAAAEKAVYPLPQTILITQDKIRSYIYESTKRWNESARATDKTWWGYQDPSFLEYYGDWIEWFWKQPSSKGITASLMSHESPIEEHMREATPSTRRIRVMKNTTFTGTQWACGSSIILINTAAEKHYLTEIIDPMLAANTREIFRQLWEKTT